MTFTINRGVLSADEIKEYSAMNPGYTATGDTVRREGIDRYGLPYTEERVIFKANDAKHRWTPYGMARQTSKYIILAMYDRYYKLTLKGDIVSLDAEDDNSER